MQLSNESTCLNRFTAEVAQKHQVYVTACGCFGGRTVICCSPVTAYGYDEKDDECTRSEIQTVTDNVAP